MCYAVLCLVVRAFSCIGFVCVYLLLTGVIRGGEAGSVDALLYIIPDFCERGFWQVHSLFSHCSALVYPFLLGSVWNVTLSK